MNNNEYDKNKMLRLARRDFSTLTNMVDDTFENYAFGFFVQQAVEKGLKTILIFFNMDFPKTHNIGALFALVSNSQLEIPQRFIELVDYSGFAVDMRYDDELLEEPINKKEICLLVRDFLQYVEKTVNG